ncbi:MAG: Fic family protein [Candidatus Diapherotrites archaeon]|jgi:Fic family protein|uniref:Fic family protein n=1 Tax=Candidatus Iainarchaeum sp. TaxID=3101447 RepID=A0A7K4BZ81_9ARCH|nr:Fic family protein [Candidatus Diapherotrites archaeon]
MFISKRKVKKRDYFYLEDRVFGKRISFFLGTRDKVEENINQAFDSLIQQTAIENLRFSQKKFKINNLSLHELLVLERLKIDYSLLKTFFPQEFESFKKDEFVRYAQGSASVEGNSLTLQEATLILSKKISISGKKIDEIREIENMRFAANESKKIIDLNERNIKRIHSAIMRGFNDKKPGEYRDGPIFITGSSVKPPSAKKIPTKMKELLNWFNKNKEKIHPVELAAEFHARFEEIHPFLDGNGRTGREILNTILQKTNYPRAIINLENRQNYIILLERVQTNKEYNKFSKFIYLCLEKQAQEINQAINENKQHILKKLLKKTK